MLKKMVSRGFFPSSYIYIIFFLWNVKRVCVCVRVEKEKENIWKKV